MKPGDIKIKQDQAHRSAVESLRQEIASIVQLLRFTYEAIVSIDESQKVILFNKGAEETFGYSAEEIIGQPVELLIPERFRATHKEHVENFARSGINDMKMHQQRSLFGLRKNGQEFPAESSIYKYHYGGVTTFTAVLRDVTHDAEVKEQLLRLASHDYLTGLPNRLLFDDRLSTAISRSERNRQKFALLFIDIDNFKSINDRLGHASGDVFLKTVAERLQTCVRESDTAARIGGDEFAVILENLDKRQDAQETFQNLLRSSVEKSVALEGEEIIPLISVGIALFPDDADSAVQLLKQADRAMFADKLSKGKTRKDQPPHS
jgi:diguanylate cyclase (GGDEF)-like protein/PAS domain S-box-containing protein